MGAQPLLKTCFALIGHGATREAKATLQTAGYELSWLLRTPTVHRAVVSADPQALKIEWSQIRSRRIPRPTDSTR